MPDDKKDFFHVGRMTEEFRKESMSTELFKRKELWELRFLLAIAQQLTVISGSLAKMVGAKDVSQGSASTPD